MKTLTQTQLVLAAQESDQNAFEILVETYRLELLVHCSRMLKTNISSYTNSRLVIE